MAGRMSAQPAREDLREELAARNREREPHVSLVISESEALELAQGRVPDQVQAMAALAVEPIDVMLARKAHERAADTKVRRKKVS